MIAIVTWNRKAPIKGYPQTKAFYRQAVSTAVLSQDSNSEMFINTIRIVPPTGGSLGFGHF